MGFNSGFKGLIEMTSYSFCGLFYSQGN